MQSLKFQITYQCIGDEAIFTADGDATDEAQLNLFRELEHCLQSISLEYELEEYGELVTSPARPWQCAIIRNQFGRYFVN